MKKKTPKTSDIPALMAQIQEQLAVLDRKLDAFMTKSLTELADAKAAVEKKAQHVPSHAPTVNQGSRPNDHRPARQMYAVVCFECGKDTEIPFKPSGDRPVFCKECFAKRKAGNAPKIGETKPQGFSIAQPSAPAPAPAEPAKAKRKTAVKKAAPKKKAAAKKSPKRK